MENAQPKASAYTPGPWHRNIKADGKYPVVFAGRNTHVAMAKGHGELPGEEIEANISLIAAAPELYEAAIDALALLEHCAAQLAHRYADPTEVLEGLRAATEKARGVYL